MYLYLEGIGTRSPTESDTAIVHPPKFLPTLVPMEQLSSLASYAIHAMLPIPTS